MEACLRLLLPIQETPSYPPRWYINEHCDGSPSAFLAEVHADGALALLLPPRYPRPSRRGLAYILAFGAIQALLQVALPGGRFLGPATPKGKVPVYRANGVAAYVTTLALFAAGWGAGVFDPGAVYDALGEIVSTSNIVSLVICALLYLKVGRTGR